MKVHNRTYYAAHRDHLIKAAKEWRNANLEQYDRWQKQYQKRKHREWKRAALKHYGEACACCGEAQFEFLTLDHVENDGNIHRREINGRSIYEYLYTHGYETGFALQTLCFNCNFAKRYNGGVCPHRASEGSTTIPSGSTPQAIGGGSAGPLGNEGEDIV